VEAWKRQRTDQFKAVLSNALLHSNSRITQMPPQIIHILRFMW